MFLTKKIRTILFLILAFLLIISIPIFIFYSKGYRFDFSRIKAVKTGAFYFKSYQSGIEIYLDGTFHNKINPIFKTTLIDNLIPKKYDVSLKKDGYHEWQKNLEIQEEMVTELRNIYLFPISAAKETVDARLENVENFYFSPDNKKIAIIAESDAKQKSDIIIYDINLKNLMNLNPLFFNVSDLRFSNDGKKILVRGEKTQNNQAWFLLNINYDNNSAVIEKIFDEKIGNNIAWHNQNPNLVYYLLNGSLFKYDSTAKTTLQAAKNINGFSMKDNIIFLIDNNGAFAEIDANRTFPAKLEGSAMPQFNKKNFYKIAGIGESKIGILDSGGKFYLFDRSKKSFDEISDSIEQVKFINNDKILYFGKKEIWVMWLSDYLAQPMRKAGAKELIARFSGNVQNAMLFSKTNEHLILQVDGQIKIAELDNRDKRNIIDFTTAEGKIYYNDFDNKLYILDKNQLYATDIDK